MRGAVQTNLLGRPHSHEHKLSKKDIGCSVKYWHRLWKPFVLMVFMWMQNGWLWAPSLKHLVVARLPHPGQHVDEKSAERRQVTPTQTLQSPGT